MPYFEVNCEVCGKYSRAWRPENPHRFCSSACQKTGMIGQKTKPNKYIIDPRHYDRIKAVYLSETGRGQIKDLAKLIGIPRWKLTRLAISRGWAQKSIKSPPWTPEEDKALESLSRYCPEKISNKLKKLGFYRSLTAIEMRMRRLRTRQNLKGYSAYKLSECFGVNEKTILRVIKQGKLNAEKRGTARTEDQGGDAWFIRPKYIRQYVIDYIAEIDMRKIDRFWLVDILTNEEGLV